MYVLAERWTAVATMLGAITITTGSQQHLCVFIKPCMYNARRPEQACTGHTARLQCTLSGTAETVRAVRWAAAWRTRDCNNTEQF